MNQGKHFEERSKTTEYESIRKSYYTSDNWEDHRLELQNELLDSFDADVYKRIFSSCQGPLYVLDLGCGTGDMIVAKLKEFPDAHFIGLDSSMAQITKARAKNLPKNYVFECLNIEAEDFSTKLKSVMQSHAIKKFQVISLSMVLLHLLDPQRVLKLLRPVLAEDGYIIIREIDDGLSFAYPDPTGCFSHLLKIGLEDEFAGNRYTGRKVYS